jgi:hypothetical protein
MVAMTSPNATPYRPFLNAGTSSASIVSLLKSAHPFLWMSLGCFAYIASVDLNANASYSSMMDQQTSVTKWINYWEATIDIR